MQRKLSLALIGVILVLFLSSTALAQPTVGVQAGQWIEYSVTYTGTPTEGHDISFARMTILDVSGTSIHVTIMSQFSNGSQETMNSTLDLSTGQLIDNFIIPANLNVGDTFYAQYLGNVTIEKAEQQTYAGATRTVISSTVGINSYVWDQATGVSVEGTSEQPDYTMHTKVSDTNMWQPQKDSLLGMAIWLAIVAVIVVVAIIAAVVLLRRKRVH
jgi:hypothetical protein